jgi:hypothetical protein
MGTLNGVPIFVSMHRRVPAGRSFGIDVRRVPVTSGVSSGMAPFFLESSGQNRRSREGIEEWRPQGPRSHLL